MRSDFLQNGPVFLVAETGARRGPPPSEGAALSLSFNRRIQNMSVGRFQLALRALDLRAAPCPRRLLRPSGSVVGVTQLRWGVGVEGDFYPQNWSDEPQPTL